MFALGYGYYSSEYHDELINQYIKRDSLIESGDIEALKELYYKLDLYETYVSEMRKRLLHELISMEKK